MSEDGRLDQFRETGRRNGLAKRKPPGICVQCGVTEERKRMGKGRCHTCHMYFWKHGRDRTSEMIAKHRDRTVEETVPR